MRLALDHHFSPVIATRLRDRGHEVVAVRERAWHELSDAALLERCTEEGRTLLTNNVVDFIALAQHLPEVGEHHAGLVFTSDTSLPRTRSTIGRYVELLDALLAANPGEGSFVDRIHWL